MLQSFFKANLWKLYIDLHQLSNLLKKIRFDFFFSLVGNCTYDPHDDYLFANLNLFPNFEVLCSCKCNGGLVWLSGKVYESLPVWSVFKPH